jgi:hypothetical protein
LGLNTNTPSIWNCPDRNNDELPTFTPENGANAAQWVIGYEYFGGMTNWVTPVKTINLSYSPVKLGRSKPYWALAADCNVQDGQGWGHLNDSNSGTPAGYYNNVPPHPSGHLPAGGNEVFVDDSVQWVRYQSMYCFHQYTGGSLRLFFWYQDMSDIAGNGSDQLSAANLKSLTSENSKYNF